jgi:hypothetical protein
MTLIRQNVKPACIFLTFLMLSVTIPFQSVLAAMIGTETTLDLTRAKKARDDINNLLARQDVQSALVSQGIDPLEAKARIDSLSDAEAIRMADEIDELSAGGGGMAVAPPLWIVLAVLAGVILVVYFFISAVAQPIEVEKKSD